LYVGTTTNGRRTEGGGVMDEKNEAIRHLQWENELLRDRKQEISILMEMGKEKLWRYRVFSVSIAGFSCILLAMICSTCFLKNGMKIEARQKEGFETINS